MRKLAGELLTSEADEVGARDHGNVRQAEDENMAVRQGIANRQSSGHHGPKNVTQQTSPTSRPEVDLKELPRMEPATATLPRGVHGEAPPAPASLCAVLVAPVLAKGVWRREGVPVRMVVVLGPGSGSVRVAGAGLGGIGQWLVAWPARMASAGCEGDSGWWWCHCLVSV